MSLKSNVAPKKFQQGLGLISAIFVITVLAVIIAGMTRFLSLGQKVTEQEFLGARAITAAQTGIELELTCLQNSLTGCSTLIPVGNPEPAVKDYWPGPASTATFSIPGLRGCRAEVFYRSVSAAGQAFWTIDSTGFCGTYGGLDGASRKVIIRAAQQ